MPPRANTTPPAAESPGARGDWLMRTPAWLLSVATHIALLLALALVMTRPAAEAPAAPTREVGILLSRSNVDQSRDYYDERPETSIAEAPAEAQSAATAAAIDPALEAGIAAALPQAAEGASLAVDAAFTPDLELGGGRRRGVLPGLGDDEILANDALFGRAAMNRSAPTSVSIFGSAGASGRSFVFVLDRSRSMAADQLGLLAAAERELAAAIDSLDAAHQFQILAYHQQVAYFNRRAMSPATEANKAAARQFLRELVAVGGTVHVSAILAAVRFRPDVIFLLTDGEEPALTPAQLRRIRDEALGQTRFVCLEFGRGPRRDDEPDFLRELADMTGGDYRYIDRSAR